MAEKTGSYRQSLKIDFIKENNNYMENNVLSWNVALQKGHEPGLYPFATDHVPLGTYKAMLDFKIWAKKASAIFCYFNQVDANMKFQITVYRRQTDKMYMILGSDIDFVNCPLKTLYIVTVVLNGKGNVSFKDVKSF